MQFQEKYNRNEFNSFLRKFLPDDFQEFSASGISSFDGIQSQFLETNKSFKIGECKSLDLSIYEFRKKFKRDPRATLTKEVISLMKKYDNTSNALCIFYSDDDPAYRFSLITTGLDDNGRKIFSNPKRYSFLLGEKCKIHTPKVMLIEKGKVKDLDDLKGRFSIEVVNKNFYKELFNWYEWACQLCKYPIGNGADVKLIGIKEDENRIRLSVIRLITRLMFVWFIREKNFVPKDIFDLEKLDGILNNFDNHSVVSSSFYNAILQNLFFATLNNEISKRDFADDSSNKKTSQAYGVKTLFRDDNKESYFKISHKDFLNIFKSVPYLNGGLFECLDKDKTRYNDNKTTVEYIDGFSRIAQRRAFVPNILFFGEEKDGNEGIINLFLRYNFTVEENTPTEIEVALDPELLGRVFENLLGTYNPETSETARKDSGSFYTPREIVDFMVDEALKHHLKKNTNFSNDLLDRIFNADNFDINKEECDIIKKCLRSVRCCDISCGSGAFPMGLLNRIVAIYRKFDEGINVHQLKLDLIKNCLYGVDIQPIAVQITKLRFFISLICEVNKDESKPNFGIQTLPNLETKFVAANSLIGLDKKPECNLFQDEEIEATKNELYSIRAEHFNAKSASEKVELRKKDKVIREKLINLLLKNNNYSDPVEARMLASWDPYDQNTSSEFLDLNWMFGCKGGFDIIIGNPPYISTKGIKSDDKKRYEKEFGFSDDTYNLFTFKGIDFLKNYGCLTYIIPKTFWTTQTKRNMRDKILSNQILYIFDTANPFESVMVDTCIISVEKNKYNPNQTIKFLDGTKDLSNPIITTGLFQDKYINSQNSVIFKPTDFNLTIYEKYGKKVKELYDKWWDKIETSKKIEKYRYELEEYRKNLKPGDVALLGCLTEGGQGLATANNGKYIAVRSSTKWADNIKDSRPRKLQDLLQKKPELKVEFQGKTAIEYLSDKSEIEIASLFDKLKERYGRDIFGQGYLYKIIDDSDLANVDELFDDEKENGIDESKKFYVPYDKGDKDGNRWYLETPFAIAWSKENVRFFKTNSGKKGEGMPVLRNPQFYFKEGFCWNLINGTRSENNLKFKLSLPCVNDVGGMTLHTYSNLLSSKYIICIGNSNFASRYTESFINFTVNFQVNDCRQIPIFIPKENQLKDFEDLFDAAYKIKKNQYNKKIKNKIAKNELEKIQNKLNEMVNKLYGI